VELVFVNMLNGKVRLCIRKIWN